MGMGMAHRFNLIEREDAQSKRMLAELGRDTFWLWPLAFLLFVLSLLWLRLRLWPTQPPVLAKPPTTNGTACMAWTTLCDLDSISQRIFPSMCRCAFSAVSPPALNGTFICPYITIAN